LSIVNLRQVGRRKRNILYHFFLKPEYNLLQVAGSRLGSKHSEEAITKMRYVALNRSDEHNTKLREHLIKLHGSATINAKISATMTAAFINGRKLSEKHFTKLTTSRCKAIEVLGGNPQRGEMKE
jgi:hypothetical protein